MTFKEAKKRVVGNFSELEQLLEQAINQGLVDENSSYYNMILTLKEDVPIAQDWPQLSEIIYKGKRLEEDIDTWLSLKGYTTIELLWPSEEADASPSD